MVNASETPVKSDDSLVSILTSQRDRYRQRMSDFEEQNRITMIKVTGLKIEIERLTRDNVGMVEKMRYTQSYSAVYRLVQV